MIAWIVHGIDSSPWLWTGCGPLVSSLLTSFQHWWPFLWASTAPNPSGSGSVVVSCWEPLPLYFSPEHHKATNFPHSSSSSTVTSLKMHPRPPADSCPHLSGPLFYTAAAAAKSLQLCPTLCDPINVSPWGSPVPGILQARTLEWVANSFSTKTTQVSCSRIHDPQKIWGNKCLFL